MYDNKRVAAVIAAAGKGSRMKGTVPKQYLSIEGEAILYKTVKAFFQCEYVDEVTVVCDADNRKLCEDILSSFSVKVVTGGKERQDSVYEGLKTAAGDIILIHDGARPYITDDLIVRVIAEAAESGAAVPCVRPKDTIRTRGKTLKRDELFCVQTPQGFKKDIIAAAYEAAYKDGFYGTDDAVLAEKAGYGISIVEGDYDNIKVTTREDLPMETRTGTGFDVHCLVEGRKLILGGVEIPYEKGLLGHSDADVLIHAIMDAILGAVAAGDIGKLFPDSDEKFKGISSMILLEETGRLIREKGYKIGNIDSTVVCQRPKLAPYIDEMRENIGKALMTDKDRVSVKATTTEELGYTGRGEGIEAQAVCILTR